MYLMALISWASVSPCSVEIGLSPIEVRNRRKKANPESFEKKEKEFTFVA